MSLERRGVHVMWARIWTRFAVGTVVFAALLFGAAGTLEWLAAWLYLVLLFGDSLLMTVALARRDPALIEERMKPLIQRDQPLWDRILIAVLAVSWLCWIVLIGLDAVRFGWSSMPLWLQWIGGAGIVLALWIWYRTFLENTYATAVVRIQTERGHRVVSTGPYAVVRHPLYASALIFFVSTGLALGSWLGVAGAIWMSAILVVRTSLEDRELQRGLDGYSEYAGQVRYRLIPLVW